MEFDEIIVKETPGLCRCCLSEGCYKDLSTEYTWMDEQEIYADMLLECFDISISQHMEGPNGPNRLICEVCITRLRDACNFKKQVLDSEKKFVDMVGRGEFKAKVVVAYEPMKAETSELQPVEEIEVEYLEDDMDFDDGNQDDPEPSVSEDVTVTALPVKGKRGRPKKTVVKLEKKKPKTEEKPKTKIAKDEVLYENCTSMRRRKNLQTLFNNTTILPFKWRGKYQCFYCGMMSFAEYPEFRKHTKSHGLCSTSDISLKLIKGNHIELKIDISEIACEVCYEPFTNFNEIIDHLIAKHGLEYDKTVDTSFQEYRLADNRCHSCEQEFPNFANLITHTNIAHPKNSFICGNCGLKYNRERDLTIHLRNYHKYGGYHCTECSEVFSNSLLLIKHKNNFHYPKCKVCDAPFPSYTLLQKHKERDHPDDGRQILCHYCSKQCKSAPSLKLHLRKCNMKTVNDSIPAFPEETMQPKQKRDIIQVRKNIQCILNMSTAIPFRFFTRFSCFHCSKNFIEFDDLKSHVVVEHPVCDLKDDGIMKCKGEHITVKIDISALSCKVCFERLDNLDDLIDHLISKHNASYDKSITECFEAFKIIKDNIPCNVCSNVFRYFGSLLRHINSEHSNKNKICHYCGRSFKSVVNLNMHLSNAHTGACECEFCGAKYKNQWCLGRHKAKCHNAKEFQCSKCDERFQSEYHKQRHMIKAHEIGHKCTYCGKMFTRNSFMKDHIRRTHLKEKTVPCSVCNEKFFNNYLLKLHMVRHKGERNFSCNVCGKAFLRRSNLKRHIEIHKKYGHAVNKIIKI